MFFLLLPHSTNLSLGDTGLELMFSTFSQIGIYQIGKLCSYHYDTPGPCTVQVLSLLFLLLCYVILNSFGSIRIEKI